MGWLALGIGLLLVVSANLVSGAVVFYYAKTATAVAYPQDTKLDGKVLRTYVSTDLAVQCLTRCQVRVVMYPRSQPLPPFAC